MSNPAVYQDQRGWKYRVMEGLRENTYKARYHKPDKDDNIGWHCYKRLPWRDTFEEAQVDLDALAKKKQWELERE